MPAIRSLIALLVCATFSLAEPAKVRTLAGAVRDLANAPN